METQNILGPPIGASGYWPLRLNETFTDNMLSPIAWVAIFFQRLPYIWATTVVHTNTPPQTAKGENSGMVCMSSMWWEYYEQVGSRWVAVKDHLSKETITADQQYVVILHRLRLGLLGSRRHVCVNGHVTGPIEHSGSERTARNTCLQRPLLAGVWVVGFTEWSVVHCKNFHSE